MRNTDNDFTKPLIKDLISFILFETKRKISKKRFVMESAFYVAIGIILLLPCLFFKEYSILGVIYDVASILIICNVISLFLLLIKKPQILLEYCYGIISIVISIIYIILNKHGNMAVDIIAMIVFDILTIKRYAAYLSNINYQEIVAMYEGSEIKAKEYNKKKKSLERKHNKINKLVKRNREYYEKYADTKKQKKIIEKQLEDIDLGYIDDAEEILNRRYSIRKYLNDFCVNSDVIEYRKNMYKFAEGMNNALEDINICGEILKRIGEILEIEKNYINSYTKPLQQKLPEETRQILMNEFYEHINSDRKAFQINIDERIRLLKNITI